MYKYLGSTHSIMVILTGNGYSELSLNPGKVVWISHSINTFGKSIHPIILPSAMGKQ